VQFHGKSFHRIRQMLPDKSIATLVKYYYSWKKTRTRTSLMDRQARKLQAVREEGRYGEEAEGASEEEEEEEEDKEVRDIFLGENWELFLSFLLLIFFSVADPSFLGLLDPDLLD
jgi:hypothetical protein